MNLRSWGFESPPAHDTDEGPDPTRIRAFVVPGRGGRGPLWWVSGWRRLRPSTVGSGVAGMGIDCPGPEATKMRRRAGALVRGLGDWCVLWRIRRPLGVAEGHVLMAWARTHRGRRVRTGHLEAVVLRWPACCDRHPRPRPVPGCQPAGGRAEADRRVRGRGESVWDRAGQRLWPSVGCCVSPLSAP